MDVPQVSVRGVTLGRGRTKIIVPLVAPDAAGALAAADRAAASPADIVEWRVDHYLASHHDSDLASDRAGGPKGDLASGVADLACRLAARLRGKPLLFTVRTAAEGGLLALDADEYLGLIETACACGCIDLIDIEIDHPGAAEAINAAHRHGISVIGSHHDFAGTPPLDVMVATLSRAQTIGAQIGKLAVMARLRTDADALLQATARAAKQSTIPLITLAMGGAGIATRLLAGRYGSCATFASLGDASSAPGQLPVEGVARWLREAPSKTEAGDRNKQPPASDNVF